jgi:hypothetical protein
VSERHIHVVRLRVNVARWTAESGDPRAAVKLFEDLLPVAKSVLGIDHPETKSILGAVIYYKSLAAYRSV